MQEKPLPFNEDLDGISKKTIEIHHDKLYVGYVNKSNEIAEKLSAISKQEKIEGNATYSELRALKDAETFSNNGVYLHEDYFECLGGDGLLDENSSLAVAIIKKWGSVEGFVKYFSACAMSSRGWTMLAWDARQQKLRIFNGDAHNQGGVWGATPILVLDVYEHAYFMDYGSDRKAYIDNYLKNINWKFSQSVFEKLSK